MTNNITSAKNLLSKVSNFKLEVSKESWNRFISVTSEYFSRVGIIPRSIKKVGWKFECNAMRPGLLKLYNNKIYIIYNSCICCIEMQLKDKDPKLIIYFYNINLDQFSYFNNSIIAICRLLGHGFDCQPIIPFNLNLTSEILNNSIDCEYIILSYKNNKIEYRSYCKKYEIQLGDE